jgi:integration host factor subunit beta
MIPFRVSPCLCVSVVSPSSSTPGRPYPVTKKEIVRQIAEELGLTQHQTKDIVQRTLDEITRTLVAEGRIELRNFGVFEVRRHAPRRARNPRTGERVEIPAKNVVTFKAGKEMEALIRAKDAGSPA